MTNDARQAVTDAEVEAGARAAYEFDWPKDRWDRLGPGFHQDRYKGMIRTAFLAATRAPVQAAEEPTADQITYLLELAAERRKVWSVQAADGEDGQAPKPCSDLTVSQLLEWLYGPQWINGSLDPDSEDHMEAAARLIEQQAARINRLVAAHAQDRERWEKSDDDYDALILTVTAERDALAAQLAALQAALTRIATDNEVSSIAGNPALWPSTVASDALRGEHDKWCASLMGGACDCRRKEG
jgi:hypothetical protein